MGEYQQHHDEDDDHSRAAGAAADVAVLVFVRFGGRGGCRGFRCFFIREGRCKHKFVMGNERVAIKLFEGISLGQVWVGRKNGSGGAWRIVYWQSCGVA